MEPAAVLEIRVEQNCLVLRKLMEEGNLGQKGQNQEERELFPKLWFSSC